MIFCGDTVFPLNYKDNIIDVIDYKFLQKEKIVNLESLIDLGPMNKLSSTIGLYSTQDLTFFLKELNVVSCSQANNHITDFNTSINKQKKFLKSHGIDSFGAGDNIDVANQPYYYQENSENFAVLAFGWKVIGCKYATLTGGGVNPMEHEEIFLQVRNLKKNNPNLNIILTFHGNYELELYPQPAHRAMFFDLIEEGVKAIFCHHPHIVGGYEIYNNAPIFYSLGNFYLPEVDYGGYKLKYPDIASEGLSVEFNLDVEKINLYWTYKGKNNIFKQFQKECLKDSVKLKKLTPFTGMNHMEYLKWFKKNRKKNKLLPIYKNYDSSFEELFNNIFVKLRQEFIYFLVKMNWK